MFIPINTDNIKNCICGNGWLAYIDNNNQIHRMIIDSYENYKLYYNSMKHNIGHDFYDIEKR